MQILKKIILLLILVSQSLFSIDIKELSGSFANISPEIQNEFSEPFKSIENSSYLISPILGAILFESGVLWNYYKFADKTNPVGNLAKLLFHENLIRDPYDLSRSDSTGIPNSIVFKKKRFRH